MKLEWKDKDLLTLRLKEFVDLKYNKRKIKEILSFKDLDRSLQSKPRD
jgi:hypothetical protein